MLNINMTNLKVFSDYGCHKGPSVTIAIVCNITQKNHVTHNWLFHQKNGKIEYRNQEVARGNKLSIGNDINLTMFV